LLEHDVSAKPQPRPVRKLLLLALAFIAGAACTQCLRFTHPVPNELFGAAVLSAPFLALRPLSQLPRIPRVIGRIAVTPILLFSLFTALSFVACGELQLQPGQKSCMQELGRVDQQRYSVQLVHDGCGGAVVGFMLLVEQHMPLLPGLYLVRSVDIFDGAYEGNLTVVGLNQVRLQIPKGVEGSGWHQEVDHVYRLKPHLYF
jgi:hypothetical protein